jgi:hypothetical protein
MRDADAITKLYDKVDTYSAEDWWYFDAPLVIWLCKPLRSCCQWLVNVHILVEKSEQWAMSSQRTLNQYNPHLPSLRTVQNATLEWIGSVWQYFQTNLLNLWSSQTPGPVEKKIQLLWFSFTLSLLAQVTKLSFLTNDVV